ncbi:hypothetical protein J6590_084072, partial [Homalodisca vitripennis]
YLTITILLECIELAAMLTFLICRNTMLIALQCRLMENITVNYEHQNNDNINTHGNNVITQSFDYTQNMEFNYMFLIYTINDFTKPRCGLF